MNGRLLLATLLLLSTRGSWASLALLKRPAMDTMAASQEQMAFEKQVQEQGLLFFQGDWRLVKSEGQACAPQLRSSAVGVVGLRFEPLSSVPSARPNFAVMGINQGDQKTGIGLSGTTRWSRASLQGTVISQRETRRTVFFITGRADRQIEVFRDGSLSITVSEEKGSKVEHYRCVYQKPYFESLIGQP
ncbi:MAG: hypothetical protein KF802_05995 [Bdellovibrionaceae bacterium]|nr:hypothetical protein [Pseudobdellovibrionaceae bacterium]MBX3032472.1 hypothetical protein [Pseudobdellovibrionaceae bacterium]